MAEKAIEFKYKSPNDSPGYLLGQLTMLWQRKQKQILDPLNLTHTQFILLASLAWLSKKNKEVTQVDIAEQSNSDRMMVSKVLRTLEQKKFIKRQEHKTDTRAKTVLLTETGIEIFQIALQEVEQVDFDFFSKLGATLPAFNANILTLINRNS